MRHLVLGAGGIGGLLAGVLADSGEEVSIVAPAGAPRSRELRIRSAVFGDLRASVPVVTSAPAGADVLWVAVKAPQLQAALTLADPGQLTGTVVVPLLNGIDHVAALRERFDAVCPATIRIASHRAPDGEIEQTSPFAQVAVASNRPAGAAPPVDRVVVQALSTLRAAGFETTLSDDETTLLWDKLAFLAPIALATTAYDRPLGDVRGRPDFLACLGEAVTAARQDGAATRLEATEALTRSAPAGMLSSMQIDVAHGREPELDAIAGAILRRSGPDGAVATRALAERIQARIAGAGSGDPRPG